MTIRRVTAREFQKRFQRYEEPVLVNQGIFFPEITVELHDLAASMSTGTDSTTPNTSARPSGDHLSKTAQAKGKTRL